MHDLINYENDPGDGSDPVTWTSSTFKSHWFKMYLTANGRYPRWGIKESTLLSKLMREYDPAVLSSMMGFGISASQEFNVFYMNAAQHHERYKELSEKWEW